ncbi:MAG TPA: YdeI/OmpD-associated family protein [Chloroflexota bacterium]|nr:YdeI/OmpD-associated family protein [Chloroflexota bacterium]
MDVHDASVLDLPDAAGWESWLAAQHTLRTEVWLRIARRHSGIDSITVAEALDVALCYGWIDGQRKAHDGVSYLQRYSRRRPGSTWSKVNVAKVEALLAAGRMQPAGLAEVAAAKADGRWEAAYESQRHATVPPDLAAALAADAPARSVFERLGQSERYAVILPLLKARTPEMRAKTLARAVARLAAQT